jgi:enterochelin esterase-like enzyme
MGRVWLLLVGLLAGWLVGCEAASTPVAMVLPTSAPTVVPLVVNAPTVSLVPPLATPTSWPTATIPPTLTPTPLPTATPRPCAPSQLIPGSYNSWRTNGQESHYLLYQPPCYGDDGRQYPTLYLFPGNTQDETAWINYGLIAAADELIATGEIPPMLIVLADNGGGSLANYSSGGSSSYEGLVLEDLIPHIEATTCAWADPAGRAIGGISRGGYWALMIAFRHPEQFVSVGGHSAALLDTHAGPDMNPQYTGLNNPLGDLRIYLDSGDRDFIAANARLLQADMAARGIAHTYVLNAGTHEDSYWPQHVHEYLRWYAEPWLGVMRGEYPACVR